MNTEDLAKKAIAGMVAEYLAAKEQVTSAEEKAREEEWGQNRLPLEEQIAETMAICTGAIDDTPYLPIARAVLRACTKSMGRPPTDYTEFEAWAVTYIGARNGQA